MRAALIFLSFFALCISSACSSETGILIKTSASDDVAEPIQHLRFFVGKNNVGDALYFADEDPLEDVELGGRDIVSSPYRLLLTPQSTNEEDEFVVAVLAFGEGEQPIGFGRLSDPVKFLSDKVLQWDLVITAIGGDVFVTDTGCLKFKDENGEYVHIGTADDADCDGFTAEDGDCDDLDPNLSPGNPENCSNGIDDNCNGLVDNEDTLDFDADGFAACGAPEERDCNDHNDAVYPGAEEICDGLDNDCNRLCDDRSDADGDSVTTCGTLIVEGQCIGEGEPDCDDEDEDRFPGNPETCDGVDNDCSGVCDDDPSLDPDSDGYTQCGSVIGECGTESFLIDCVPDDGQIHPGAQDFCDGIDNDCDGNDAETSPCFVIGAGAACVEGERACIDGVLQAQCVGDLSETKALPLGICESYSTCEQDGSVADPFACILNEAASAPVTETCQAVMRGGDSCPGTTVQIKPPGGPFVGDFCTYAIIGGEFQQGYQLSLLSSDGVVGQVAAGCSVDLDVQGLPGAGDATISIGFDDGTSVSVLIVRLKGHRELECGNLLGLTCNSWPAAVAVTN